MRTACRVAGLFGAVIFVALWLALGANRGWTKTTHTRMEKDPVTEIEYPVVKKQFSPGVEFLAAGLLVSAALVAVSFAFKTKPNH